MLQGEEWFEGSKRDREEDNASNEGDESSMVNLGHGHTGFEDDPQNWIRFQRCEPSNAHQLVAVMGTAY